MNVPTFLRSFPASVRQVLQRLRPDAPEMAASAEALAQAERQTATAALLAEKIPEWKAREGQDWLAKHYYRIYLAFVAELPPSSDVHTLLAGPQTEPLSEGNQALVQAYKSLIHALETAAPAPVELRMRAWRTSGLQRVNRVLAIAGSGALLLGGGLSIWIWRAQGLGFWSQGFLSLLLVGVGFAAAYLLGRNRDRFNPNRQAMAALEAKYEELEKASLAKIHEHARDAAVELHYAVMSGKSWVFSRLTNKWAGEKYIFLGDAHYEAACIHEVIDHLTTQAWLLAQGLPVVAKPAETLLDLSAPQQGLGSQCPRCRTAYEPGDHFCMACGLRLTAATRGESQAV